MSALHKDAQRVLLNSNKVSGETHYLHSPRTALHWRMREPASEKQLTIHTHTHTYVHANTNTHTETNMLNLPLTSGMYVIICLKHIYWFTVVGNYNSHV